MHFYLVKTHDFHFFNTYWAILRVFHAFSLWTTWADFSLFLLGILCYSLRFVGISWCFRIHVDMCCFFDRCSAEQLGDLSMSWFVSLLICPFVDSLGSLGLSWAPFGLPWAPFGLPCAPFSFLWAPFTPSFLLLWGSMWLALASFGPLLGALGLPLASIHV